MRTPQIYCIAVCGHLCVAKMEDSGAKYEMAVTLDVVITSTAPKPNGGTFVLHAYVRED